MVGGGGALLGGTMGRLSTTECTYLPTSLLHAPDCDRHDCFVVQGKKQETNTGGKAKLPDHYRCTITCALWGKRKHYEDECYQKQRV